MVVVFLFRAHNCGFFAIYSVAPVVVITLKAGIEINIWRQSNDACLVSLLDLQSILDTLKNKKDL